MDEDALLQAERHQIEQIRQLEFEELQVEEVEEDESSDDERDLVGPANELTFNTYLAPLHSYLGEVEDTHHRLTFLDGGSILTLPLFYLEGVVLFPEAILPLRVVQPDFISAVERALAQVDAPYTIGVVHVSRDHNRRLRFATIGTTAEIRQYRRLDDGSLNVVTRGRQRFRLKRHWTDSERVLCGKIHIIQEDLPLRIPRDAFGKVAPLSNCHSHSPSNMPPSNASPYGYGDEENDSTSNSEDNFENELSQAEKTIHQSAIDSCYGYDRIDESTSSDDEKLACHSESKYGNLNNSRSTSSSRFDREKSTEITMLGNGNTSASGYQSRKGREPKRCWRNRELHQFRRVQRAFWPYWVYHMYDSYCLAKTVAEMWKQIVGAPSMDGLLKKPDLLSFHIASKIPMSESTRQELLEIDGISYRLRREIELLKSFDLIQCKNCQTVIARRRDMLVMSTEGPLGAYVNPHGFVHEIMTFYKTNGLALIGRPDTQYSWFPGYAWTITNCSNCESQMGWLFTATKKKLKPQSFWGIRSCQVADDAR